MRFNSELVLSLLIAVPSTFAALNGSCANGRQGICIKTGTCSSYSGTTTNNNCPQDPADVKCCENIPCSFNGMSGNCMFESQCDGETHPNLCPGGSNFKCCVRKSNVTGVGQVCTDQGISGKCIDVNNTGCSTRVVTGRCPGPSNVRCCLNANNATPKYFTINELIRSDTATRQGIDNTPSQAIRDKLNFLIVNCLDPIREIFGKPIIVTSGYRCEKLNQAVGGAANSQHKKGEAADLVPGNGGTLKQLYQAIIKFGNYDQFILENSSWAHVSYTTNPRRQILYYNGSSYIDITNNYQNYI